MFVLHSIFTTVVFQLLRELFFKSFGLIVIRDNYNNCPNSSIHNDKVNPIVEVKKKLDLMEKMNNLGRLSMFQSSIKYVFQPLGMYILGEETVVSNTQDTVAGGHVAWGTCGHLPHGRHCHSGHHCGNTNLHGPQGQ